MNRRAPKGWIKSQAGFSLIEVAIAIGIVGFAMISILGMVPLGLASFKQARNTTVESDIVQALTAEINVTAFSSIPNMAYTNQNQAYYYDDEGNALSQTGSVTTTAPSNTVYTAKISCLTISSTSTSSSTSTAGQTTFPVSLSNEAYNIQIQITNTSQPLHPHTYSVIVANKNY